ncbi:hypothetical protein CQ010_16525 [Arthrobacter sp. MYb211]|uniref:hypothetical protein n=1 Tax=unclassified Arthrobacter TaxID=235627 RepID=UPI000CFAE6A0|nr:MULTISPECIES: hypothetical protein [unclassified Arthrobacter]PRA09855.1 hypothetical protein CQ015_16510 [Arthrobacter sp. MYb221]PRC04863.1 hypothetical protein CQ010_16525 [Arthrobacter sp. MYb211]
MGIFDSIARGLGSLRLLSDTELEDEREALRQRYVSSGDVGEASNLYDELHRYDDEMTRRANNANECENPNPPEPRHREHGWYLPNDD